MIDHATTLALEAYRQDTALVEAACEQALADGTGVLVTKKGARVHTAVASELVPAGQMQIRQWGPSC